MADSKGQNVYKHWCDEDMPAQNSWHGQKLIQESSDGESRFKNKLSNPPTKGHFKGLCFRDRVPEECRRQRSKTIPLPQSHTLSYKVILWRPISDKYNVPILFSSGFPGTWPETKTDDDL